MLHLRKSEHDEATGIATEVKRIIAHTGGLLVYGDFAVLCQSSVVLAQA